MLLMLQLLTTTCQCKNFMKLQTELLLYCYRTLIRKFSTSTLYSSVSSPTCMPCIEPNGEFWPGNSKAMAGFNINILRNRGWRKKKDAPTKAIILLNFSVYSIDIYLTKKSGLWYLKRLKINFKPTRSVIIDYAGLSANPIEVRNFIR